MMKSTVWLRNIKRNQELSGFKFTINEIRKRHEDEKTVVIGAGPGFKKYGIEDLHKLYGRSDIIKIACDGALPTLAREGIIPDYVVSVDAHPVVADFYRYWFDKMPNTTIPAILSTTTDRNVVGLLEMNKCPIYWWQAFFDGDEQIRTPDGGEQRTLFVKNVPSLNTGGNVGTTCMMLALFVLKSAPIGLMGLEFAWSDETPLMDTQYYSQLMKILKSKSKVKDHFHRVKNQRDGKTYVADPGYYYYFLAFQDLWSDLSENQQNKVINLTKQGILQAPHLKTLSMTEFLEL